MSEPIPDAPSFITRYRWRLRLGTVLAIVIIGVSLLLGWYLFVRAPGPRSACDHIAHLRRRFPQEARALEEAVTPLAAVSGSRPITHTNDQLCMWYFTTEQKELSFFAYGRLSRCVSSADTPRELFACL